MKHLIYSTVPGEHRCAAMQLHLPTSTYDETFYYHAALGRLRGAYKALRRKRWTSEGLVPGLSPAVARRAIFDTMFAVCIIEDATYIPDIADIAYEQ
jgi:hypothetical protein